MEFDEVLMGFDFVADAENLSGGFVFRYYIPPARNERLGKPGFHD